MLELLLTAIKWLLLVVLAGLVFWIVLATLKRFTSRLYLWFLSVIHGCICFLLIITYFHSDFGGMEENGWLFKSAQWMHSLRNNDSDLVKQPFILIDNSGNKMLIPDLYANEEDSIQLVVTDRRKLAQVLALCADNRDQISTVVCDIRFEEKSQYDSLLIQQISRLAANDQIILAGSGETADNALGLNPELFGAVSVKPIDNLITHFVLFDDAQHSLPYKLYLKTEGKMRDSQFGFLDIEIGRDQDVTHIRSSLNPRIGLKQKESNTKSQFARATDEEALPLGYFLGDLGRMEFMQRIRIQGDKKPIIFIGEFEGSGGSSMQTDIHGTLSGNVHGSRILIDIFNDLRLGSHRAFHPIYLVPLLFLILLSAYIFRNAYYYPKSEQSSEDNSQQGPARSVMKIVADTILAKLKDVSFILTLLIGGLIIIIVSGIVINLFALLAYFILLESMFSGIMSNRKKINSLNPKNMKKLLFAFMLQVIVALVNAQDPVLKVLVLQPQLNDQNEAHVTTSAITLRGAIFHVNELVLTRINDTDILLDKDGSFSYPLTLKEGKNEIIIGSIDLESNKDFLKIILYYESASTTSAPEKPSSTVTAKGTMPSEKTEVATTDGSVPEIFALIVGVSEFINDPSHKLKYAAKDAMEYYEFIRSPQGGQVPEDHIKLLINENATKRNILTELKEMLLYADEDDIFMFYYSGHGQSVNNNKEFCLYPYEIVTTSIDDIEIYGVSQTDLMSRISEGRPGKKIMFIDACHSGMLASNQKGQGQIAATLMKGMAEADNTLTILTSSSDNEVSFEDDELSGGHGIFTYYLIEGLQGEADKQMEGNNDSTVTVFELYEYVKFNTNLRSKKVTGLPQRPDQKCVQCNDFPLSMTGDYDIKKSNVKTPPTQLKPKPSTDEKNYPNKTPDPDANATQTTAEGTIQPGGFTLIQKKPANIAEYTQPEDISDLRNVIYASEDGNKITFYAQYGDDYYFSGWLNGEIIVAKGKKLGNTIEFADPDYKPGLKKGYLLFMSDEMNEIRFTIELTDGRKTDLKMQRLGKPVRNDLNGQKFFNQEKDIELRIYAVYGNDIYLSGHVADQLVLARGVLKGDAILFVDNSKEWHSTGKIMLNDQWNYFRLQFQIGQEAQMEYDLQSAGQRALNQLKGVTYSNADASQTITFDKQYGDDVWFTGYIGLGYIKGKAKIMGDILQVNDDEKGKSFQPTRFLLRNDLSDIDIGFDYADGQRIEISLPKK